VKSMIQGSKATALRLINRRHARPNHLLLVVIALFALSSHVSIALASSEIMTQEEEEALLCQPHPDDPSLEDWLEQAMLFGIDPSESSEFFHQIADLRPQHFSILLGLSVVNNESYQVHDNSFSIVTAPARPDAESIAQLARMLTGHLDPPDGAAIDLAWAWDKVLRSNPIDEVGVDWACVQSQAKNAEQIFVIIAFGEDDCERLSMYADAGELPPIGIPTNRTSLTLEILVGRNASIARTALAAPVFRIKQIGLE